MMVLGLDLSLLATGGCWIHGDRKDPTIETFIMRRESASGVEGGIKRLLSIANELVYMVLDRKPSLVIIEAPAQNQKWQAAAIGELHGVVKTKLYEQTCLVPVVVQATKMRKAVVGKIESKRTKVFKPGKDGKPGKVASVVDYGVIPGKKAGKTKRATIKDIIEQRLAEKGMTFPSQDEMDAYVTARYAWDNLLHIDLETK